MIKTCTGCGVELQNEDAANIGYVISLDQTLCSRCFRIIHYNDYQTVAKTNEEFLQILSKINETNDLVLYVIDLFGWAEHIKEIRQQLKNPMILVLTKRDILPKSVYDDKLLEYMNQFHLNPVDQILISSNKNYHFDELMELIGTHQTSKNVYVIGYSNAGKSTMINHMIQHYSKLDTSITTSMLPSTTLNNIEIELTDSLTVIDTPGLLEAGNMANILTGNDLKKILPKKEIREITYQVRTSQSIVIDKYIQIDVLTPTNLTCYVSNQLEIERFYRIRDIDVSFETHSFQVRRGEDIVIAGMGFIKFSKACEVQVSSLEGIHVYKRDSLI